LAAAISSIMDTQIPEWDARKKRLSEKQAAFRIARGQFDEAVSKRAEAERILENCRAGLLAQGLEDGKKCPVCGAVHHPEPAALPDTSVTEEEVRALQAEEKTCQEAKSKAFTEVETAKTSLEQYEEQLRLSILDCLEDKLLEVAVKEESLDELIPLLKKAQAKVESKRADNRKLQNTLARDCRALDQAVKDLEKAQGPDSEGLQHSKDGLAADRQRTEADVAAVMATLDSIGQLSCADWSAAEAERNRVEEEADRILDAIQSAAAKKQEADSVVTTCKAALQTLEEGLKTQTMDRERFRAALDETLKSKGFTSVEEMLAYVIPETEITAFDEEVDRYHRSVSTNAAQLAQAVEDAKGKKKVDAALLQTACEEQSARVEQLRKRVNLVENRIAINEEKRVNITAQQSDLENARRESAICDRLYKLVKGNTGNGKITLEQYIQAAGFDGIIEAANRRLRPMSDGQYELYRQEDSLGKKSNTFLDLEVLDNYTGHRRPVGSLSGGESFKASLSLALGLSDTVSSNLGGIQMDALFVDEGFGTLDRKSIDSAMEILLGLSGANKLVGIISHREELVENIPQQIKVQKTKDGSRISIESGL
jgi:exonuclease SbcC